MARAAAGPAEELDPATTIRGRVTDADDAPIVGVRVTLHAVHPKGHVEGGVHLAEFDRVLAETTSRWDGTFGLPAGSAEERIVVAAKGGFVPAARRASPAAECALRLNRGQALTLRIEDLAGEPVAGATVYARGGFDDPSDVAAPVATSDAEGRAAVRFGPKALDRLGLVVRARGFAATDVGDRDSVSAGEERTVVLEDASVIAGRVVDGDGAPIPDVVVQLGSAWDEAMGNGLTGRVVSASDGAFRFEALSPRLAREISARHADRDARIQGVHPGRTDVRLVLRRRGGVRGIVVHEDGTPAAGGRVDLHEGDVAVGADGSFESSELAPGPRWIRAKWPERDATEVGSVHVDVPEGGIAEGVRIVVREERSGSRLRVKVVDAEDHAVAEFGVKVFQGTRLIALRSESGNPAGLTLPVPAGTAVRVVASPSRWGGHESPAASADAVTVAHDDTASDPVLLRLGPPGRLTIRLEDPHGTELPLSNARVSYWDEEAPPPQGGSWPLDPARTVDITVTVPGFARHRVRVEPPHADLLDLRIRLSRPARLVGRLLESDGRPAVWRTPPVLQFPFDGGHLRDFEIVGKDGRFEKDGLPPGDATLAVGMPGDMFADDSCRLRRALRLEAGATLDLGTIVLPRIELVDGVVTDESGAGLGGAIVGFVDGPTQVVVPGTYSGPDGRFRAKLPLREGVRFSVVRSGHGPALVPFDPAGPRPVRIVLRPGGRVRVRFDGDFSGVRFRTSPQEEWRFPLLAARPSVSDEEITLDGLPAGEVELTTWVDGVERTTRVTVVAGETVEARF